MANQDEKQSIGKDIVTAGATAAIAAATATAAPASAAVWATIPTVLGGICDVAMNWKRLEAQKFWDDLRANIATDAGVTPEEAEAHIQLRAEDPRFRDAILRSVRALMDAVDGAATVPLARLVAEYERDGAMADALFRGVARLLSELSRTELKELRDMLEWAFEGTEASGIRLIATDLIWDGTQGEPHPASWHVLRYTNLTGSQRMHEGRFESVGNPTRLLHLLEMHGVARQPNDQGWPGYNPVRIWIERDVAERLQRILSD